MSFYKNIIGAARNNVFFRHVIATAKHCQVVFMALQVGEDIGKESHDTDQLFLVVEGHGKATVGTETKDIAAGDGVMVPAETPHNITNTGKHSLKLLTVYAPAEHKHGIIRKTKEEARTVPE